MNILISTWCEDFDRYIEPLEVKWTDSLIPKVVAKAILSAVLGEEKPKIFTLSPQRSYFEHHELTKFSWIYTFEPFQIKNTTEWEVWQIQNLFYHFRKGLLAKGR
jgi:hypothetical protein